MEFNYNFKQFPRWGRVIMWALVAGILGAIVYYAATRGAETVTQLITVLDKIT
jgi:hypothetical protein